MTTTCLVCLRWNERITAARERGDAKLVSLLTKLRQAHIERANP